MTQYNLSASSLHPLTSPLLPCRLYSQGVILENHYSYELCTPTRGALLTGRYSMRLGQWNENLGELPLNETTLAQELQSAGYKTYMVNVFAILSDGIRAAVYTLPISSHTLIRTYPLFYLILGG